METEKIIETKKVKFYEMTLSPFVSVPCEDLSLLGVGEVDDHFEEESDDLDKTGFNQNEHVSASDCKVKNNRTLNNERPLCPFEKFVFTSGMEDLVTR